MPYPIKVNDVRPGDVLLLGPGPRRAHVLEAGTDPEDRATYRIVYHWETVRYAGALRGTPERLYHYTAPGQLVALASDSRTPPKPLVSIRFSLFALVFYGGGAAFLIYSIATGRAVYPILAALAAVMAVCLALTAVYQLARTLTARKATTS